MISEAKRNERFMLEKTLSPIIFRARVLRRLMRAHGFHRRLLSLDDGRETSVWQRSENRGSTLDSFQKSYFLSFLFFKNRCVSRIANC